MKLIGPTIKKFEVNYRKKCFTVFLSDKKTYSLPFASIPIDIRPTHENKIIKTYVDPELANQCLTYFLSSHPNKEQPIHIDNFLYYNRDPSFMRDLLLYNLSAQAQELFKKSNLSKNEIIRRLDTSPSQLYRLLDQTNYKKSVDEMLRLVSVLGYTVEFKIKKAKAS